MLTEKQYRSETGQIYQTKHRTLAWYFGQCHRSVGFCPPCRHLLLRVPGSFSEETWKWRQSQTCTSWPSFSLHSLDSCFFFQASHVKGFLGLTTALVHRENSNHLGKKRERFQIHTLMSDQDRSSRGDYGYACKFFTGLIKPDAGLPSRPKKNTHGVDR